MTRTSRFMDNLWRTTLFNPSPPTPPFFSSFLSPFKYASIIVTLNSFEKETEQNNQTKSDIENDHPGGSIV